MDIELSDDTRLALFAALDAVQSEFLERMPSCEVDIAIVVRREGLVVANKHFVKLGAAFNVGN